MHRVSFRNCAQSLPFSSVRVTRRPEARTVRVRAIDDREPLHHGPGMRYKLGVPVTLQMSDLPDDGETLTDFELTCNPEERRCKTLRFVYEEACPACSGSGTAVSKASSARKGKGKRQMGACLLCGGVGYRRHVTSRYEPSVNGSLRGPTSLFRPKSENGTSSESSISNGNGARPNAQSGSQNGSQNGTQ